MADDSLGIEKVPPSEDVMLLRPGYPRAMGYPESQAYGYGYGDEEEEGIRLRELWRTIRKRKWLILTISVIVTTLVIIEAYRTKSTYRASAFIEMVKERPSVKPAAGGVVIQTDEDSYFPQLSINTSLFRLTSEPLLEDVVANLKLDENPAFKQPQRASVWEAIQAIVNRASLTKPESQPPPAVAPLTSGGFSRQARSTEESERLAPFVSMVAGGLQAEQVKETRTLKVTYTHTNPGITAAVVNGIARNFIGRNFENKTEEFTNASDWLDVTTRELKAKVEKAEQDLADYTREHNIFSTDSKQTLTTDKLSRLHDQATRSETDRILKQSVFEEVKAGRGAGLPAAFADPKITALQSKLDDLEGTAANLDLKYGPDHPQVLETRQQIKITQNQLAASRRALEDKLKSEYELSARDEQSLKAALNQAKGEAVQQNQDAIQFNILRQEVETAKGLYTDFLQKTSQAKVEVAQQHNNLRLIQPARVPGAPVGPSRFRMIALGFFLSLIGGMGVAYFLEYIDNTIKTVDDVNRYVKLPSLGVIPSIAAAAQGRLKGAKASKRLILDGSSNGDAAEVYSSNRLAVIDNRSSAAEAYRVVRTSMLLSAAGNPPKTVLVTSGQPGEGKTTTVVNTAISLAQLGASVLIVDCDLRKPSVHKVFGIEHHKGLSTYLSRDIEVDELITKLQIPNLSVLPCGPIPPNPAELISSERMKGLLRVLSERYDHVLIDSPPLIHVTDPVILSSLVDGVILVVHGGKSTRAVTQRARQELAAVGAKVFGVVLNNVDVRRDGYDDYYYYRYHSGYDQKNASEVSAP
ncbi:MAG TPA: polysaccharide biosynthesis tyrosine autokinase [Blastocatellia bacterium]|nr:polysaccharide biosynthesis tyrosine autokinase [Blastocatellia bacterium]